MTSTVPDIADPTTLVVAVTGRPATQGSKRHGKGGRGMFEANPRTKGWRADIVAAAREAMGTGWHTYTGPVAVHAVFTFARPKRPARKWPWPCNRASGDLDKLLRALFDALTDAYVWRDDSQVISVIADKTYPDSPDLNPLRSDLPGVVVMIRPVAIP